MSPVSPSVLTDFAVFVCEDGREISCAWFYIDNRSSVARIENFISSPDALPSEVEAARVMILEIFSARALECGKRIIFDCPLKDFPSGSELTGTKGHEFIDKFEASMEGVDDVEIPLKHTFTPGLYMREIVIPAGTLATSKLHKTEHFFAISMGDISVWTQEAGTVRLKAPHTGITKPGTRRIFFAHADTVWTTFHATNERDPALIEAAIIEPRVNPLLKGSKQCLL